MLAGGLGPLPAAAGEEPGATAAGPGEAGPGQNNPGPRLVGIVMLKVMVEVDQRATFKNNRVVEGDRPRQSSWVPRAKLTVQQKHRVV